MPLALAFLAACGAVGDAVAPDSSRSSTMSPAARAYVNDALDVMQASSYYRARIDWPKVRADAFAAAEAVHAQTSAATYPAIRAALIALGDHHSFLQAPASAARLSQAAFHESHRADSLDGEILGGRFGYVRVPTFAPVNGGTSAQATAFADTLQALVRATDQRAPCGWVVDLRHNAGGNMWPMLAGIGPILGEGANLGAFVDANGSTVSWFYANGVSGTTAGGSASAAARTSRQGYLTGVAGQPVAVLTDGLTASSGEAIAVAFRGRPNTRSFGAPTYGVPTANAGHALSDGAVIWLMTAVDADRTGLRYVDPITPDDLVETTGAPATDDAVVAAASSWLATQAACRQ